MDDATTAQEAKRYVPSGVNAQSWLGFEQRIQERRYRALIQQIDQAIVRGDGTAAALAFEEARELRPDAPELTRLSEDIASICVHTPQPSFGKLGWSRAINAVTMLAAGVVLLVAIEWVRPAGPQPPSRTVAPVTETAPAQTSNAAAPAPTTESIAPQVADPVVPSTEPDVALPDPVATSGGQSAIAVARPAVGGPANASFRPQALLDPEVKESAREIPDNDAAAESRRVREANTGIESAAVTTANTDSTTQQPARIDQEIAAPRDPAPERAAPGPALAASVAPSPTPLSVLPSITRAVAPIVEPRAPVNEEARVAQVLDQYARAYGRLDVDAARRVWPTVDERALARAFASLQSQDVSFENCSVDVSGARATASCRGRATYVGKIGSGERRTEARQWTFELRRDANDAWAIERAQAQRMAN